MRADDESRAEAILKKAMGSPCKVLVNGAWCCKMQVVVE